MLMQLGQCGRRAGRMEARPGPIGVIWVLDDGGRTRLVAVQGVSLMAVDWEAVVLAINHSSF